MARQHLHSLFIVNVQVMTELRFIFQIQIHTCDDDIKEDKECLEETKRFDQLVESLKDLRVNLTLAQNQFQMLEEERKLLKLKVTRLC